MWQMFCVEIAVKIQNDPPHDREREPSCQIRHEAVDDCPPPSGINKCSHNIREDVIFVRGLFQIKLTIFKDDPLSFSVTRIPLTNVSVRKLEN